MKTRIIQTKIWRDLYFVSLSQLEKLLFLYLITNEKINLIGIYELTDREILFDTGIKEEELEKAKKKFTLDKKIYFSGEWVKIINYDKYNAYIGEKNETAKEKELSFVPKNIIDYEYPIDGVSIPHRYSENQNHNKNHNKNKKPKEEKSKINEIYDLFIKCFNKNKNQYKLTPLRKQKIKCRLEDAGEEMLLLAIENTSKSAWHRGDNDSKWEADFDFIIRSYEQVEKLANMQVKGMEKGKVVELSEDEYQEELRKKSSPF
jgi:hypothetical protein